ncbi:hypothetical protein [Parabacteroides merdae]|jgi:Fe-S cluster biogenesis protein NfuA|uniref:hypothetical protein n=1 Tax=Parabacteroides merdae TaxID=46503 RepID=UPI0034A1F293
MNEEKVLQLLLDLVGGEKSFEWLGEKAGRSVNRTFDRSDKMIHAVVGGLASATNSLLGPISTNGNFDPFDEKKAPEAEVNVDAAVKEEQKKHLDDALDSYNLNAGEKQYVEKKLPEIKEQCIQAINREKDETRKIKAGMMKLDDMIKEYSQKYGAYMSMKNGGVDGVRKYFKEDVDKIKEFFHKNGLGDNYDNYVLAEQKGDKRACERYDSILKGAGLSLLASIGYSADINRPLRNIFEKKNDENSEAREVKPSKMGEELAGRLDRIQGKSEEIGLAISMEKHGVQGVRRFFNDDKEKMEKYMEDNGLAEDYEKFKQAEQKGEKELQEKFNAMLKEKGKKTLEENGGNSKLVGSLRSVFENKDGERKDEQEVKSSKMGNDLSEKLNRISEKSEEIGIALSMEKGGMKGVRTYFHDDVEKVEKFMQSNGLTKEYEKYKLAELNGDRQELEKFDNLLRERGRMTIRNNGGDSKLVQSLQYAEAVQEKKTEVGKTHRLHR